jgi:hypothetical protein
MHLPGIRHMCRIQTHRIVLAVGGCGKLSNKQGGKIEMRKTLAATAAALLALGLGTAATAAPAFAKMAKPPKIKKVTFTGTGAEPTIAVKGTGLGSLPIEHAEAPLECFPPETEPGNDFGEAAFLEDPTAGWAAGKAGDCIGLVFSSYTETEVVFHLGSGYREYTPLTKGDSYEVSLNTLTKSGKVKFKKVMGA